MWPLVRRRYILPILLLFAHGCACWYTADRPDVAVVDAAAPVVKALAVIPPVVYVTPGAKFVLYARMFDHDNGVLPEHGQLKWAHGAGLKEEDHALDSIRLEARPAAVTSTTSVTATIGTLTATAQIIVLAGSVSGSADIVRGDDTPWTAPDVVLLDDTLATPPINDSLIAFVKIGVLGNLRGGAGEVARLSTNQGFRLLPTTWHSGSDVVDLSAGAATSTINALRRPAFTIWIASTSSTADAATESDAGYAFSLFTRQRTGLTLRHTTKVASSWGNYVLELGSGPKVECLGLQAKLENLGVPTSSQAFAPESLNVIYVDDIVDPPIAGEVEASAGLNGYACSADPALGSVILISLHLRNGGTLTHELGHVSGLLEPNWGHTEFEPGFSYTNMMWPYEWDATKAPRSTFSLGQAFRINVDDHSWLRWLTGQARNCDSLRIGRSCPLLEQDLVRSP